MTTPLLDIRRIAEQQGWTEASLYTLALVFIQRLDMLDQFHTFVAATAKEENESDE